MNTLDSTWPWISLAALGAFHGLNPAMGWLFAVALGFQERRLRAVVAALGPIALGHALSIGLVAVSVGLLGVVFPRDFFLVTIGATLLGFAGYKIDTRFRHTRWVGMRVRRRELVLWSFLMATAHGAGLMLAPVLAALRENTISVASAETGHGEHLGHAGHAVHMVHPAASSGDAFATSLEAVTLHSAAMIAAAAMIAILVYRKVGVAALGRYWINVDFVWAAALVVTGSITLGLGLWGIALG
jgi:hypothetical protein